MRRAVAFSPGGGLELMPQGFLSIYGGFHMVNDGQWWLIWYSYNDSWWLMMINMWLMMVHGLLNGSTKKKKKTMEHHHAINGWINYFDWTVFKNKLLVWEGITSIHIHIATVMMISEYFWHVSKRKFDQFCLMATTLKLICRFWQDRPPTISINSELENQVILPRKCDTSRDINICFSSSCIHFRSFLQLSPRFDRTHRRWKHLGHICLKASLDRHSWMGFGDPIPVLLRWPKSFLAQFWTQP